ncbi:SDR family oxidoreductase [Ferruginibacter sp. SUN106]|uniref:SDR family oxidoreductase n=1 Tax=Ferruginibacter sp. SUN106 TaxID=2978348 RepID=UPI003D35C66D
MQTVFITGGTGYIGTRLIKALQQEGNFHIKALVRKGSETKLPPGCEIVFGNALDATSYQNNIAPATILVHLIGVAHPSPAKKEQFKKIDLVSVQQAAKAATVAGIQHFVYLSVSMYPTRIMKDFQEVRAEGETLLLQQNFISSFIRPWYVLGPGHWWPLLLKPVFFILKFIPSKKQAAIHLDTVTIKQIINAMVDCIKKPATSKTIFDVPKIKSY